MTLARVDDWVLGIRDQGVGDTVILLHGLLLDSRVWDPIAERLAASYRVISVDSPGHGESPARANRYSLEEEANVLAALARNLGTERAIWVGHSMGGMKAMRVALAYPDLVEALVLVDTQPYRDPPHVLDQYNALVEAALFWGISEHLADAIARLNFHPSFLESKQAHTWRQHYASLDGRAIEGACRSVFDRTEIGDVMATLTAPTLVLHATDDVPIPIAVARRYAAELPYARFRELKGAGHNAPCESPEVIASEISSFLADVKQSRLVETTPTAGASR